MYTKPTARIVILAVALTTGNAALAADGGAQVFAEALVSQNPLATRYFMKVPQVVHLTLTDRPEQFTVKRLPSGNLSQSAGLYGEPYLMIHPSAEELGKVYEAVKDGKVTLEEKLQLAELYVAFNEKPFQPPAGAEVATPDAGYLTKMEQRLLKVAAYSKKLRFLFNKTMTAPNQFWKIFWGAQIKIVTPLSERHSTGITNDLLEELTGDIDRGQVAIKPGSLFDQLAGAVAIHLMMRDEDTQSYLPVLKGIVQKLQGESGAQALDGPPAGGNPDDHAAALKARLDVAKKLLDLVQNLG